ncbi:tetratricopeptide repeat protein [Corticibacter populi]|nr:tetratricopeptide repeat protein [Corticibacter populi]RZS29900.1 tetratricopeptide repeat protein [Corticibacter populi]
MALAAADDAAAGQRQWQSLYARAQDAYGRRDWTGAEQAARQALAQARAGQGQTGPFVASSQNILALSLQRQGRLQEAAELLGEALETSRQTLGRHANTASLAFNLGSVQEELGPGQTADQQHALASYEQALRIADALPGDTAATQVGQQALAALGRLHAERGEAQRADAYNRRLLQSQASLPPDLRADALLRQGMALTQQGQWSEAQAALEESLQLFEAAHGARDAAVVPALTALANLHHASGQHERAVPLHQRAMDILRQQTVQGGAQEAVLAGHLNELALWQLQDRQFEPARAGFEEVLALLERQNGDAKTAGEKTLARADVVGNLAQLEGQAGQDDVSRDLHRQALALYRAAPQGLPAQLGQARSLNFLAAFDYRRRRFAEAEPQFLQALALMEQALGTADERLLPVLQNLEALYLSQGRAEQARPYQLRVHELQRKQQAGQQAGDAAGTAGP